VQITGKNFGTIRPGEEIKVSEANGSTIKGIVACRNVLENSLIMAGGLAIISSLAVERTGKSFSEFSVFPQFYSYLVQNKMLVTRMNEIRVGDCILVSSDGFKTVRVLTIAVYDPDRDIAFDTGGMPIDINKMKIAKTGFQEDTAMILMKGNHLLCDCVVSE